MTDAEEVKHHILRKLAQNITICGLNDGWSQGEISIACYLLRVGKGDG